MFHRIEELSLKVSFNQQNSALQDYIIYSYASISIPIMDCLKPFENRVHHLGFSRQSTTRVFHDRVPPTKTKEKLRYDCFDPNYMIVSTQIVILRIEIPLLIQT